MKSGSVCQLKIEIPEKYPFVPPTFLFTNKIYHPNISNEGIICIDILKLKYDIIYNIFCCDNSNIIVIYKLFKNGNRKSRRVPKL